MWNFIPAEDQPTELLSLDYKCLDQSIVDNYDLILMNLAQFPLWRLSKWLTNNMHALTGLTTGSLVFIFEDIYVSSSCLAKSTVTSSCPVPNNRPTSKPSSNWTNGLAIQSAERQASQSCRNGPLQRQACLFWGEYLRIFPLNQPVGDVELSTSLI